MFFIFAKFSIFIASKITNFCKILRFQIGTVIFSAKSRALKCIKVSITIKWNTLKVMICCFSPKISNLFPEKCIFCLKNVTFFAKNYTFSQISIPERCCKKLHLWLENIDCSRKILHREWYRYRKPSENIRKVQYQCVGKLTNLSSPAGLSVLTLVYHISGQGSIPVGHH